MTERKKETKSTKARKKSTGAREKSGDELKIANHRAKYLEMKRRLIDVEADNYSKLYLISDARPESTWWNMFGHSAVIAANQLAPLLQMKLTLKPDTDHGVTFREGRVAIQNVEMFLARLKNKNIFPKVDTENAKVIPLGFAVSKEDYNLMVGRDEMMAERINKIVGVEEHLAALHMKLKVVETEVHQMVRKMDAVARDTIAGDYDTRVARAHVDLIRVVRGSMEVEGFLLGLYELVEDLFGFVEVVLNLHLAETKKILRVANSMLALRKQLKTELEKREIKVHEQTWK